MNDNFEFSILNFALEGSKEQFWVFVKIQN